MAADSFRSRILSMVSDRGRYMLLFRSAASRRCAGSDVIAACHWNMSACRGFALLSRNVLAASRCQVLRTRQPPSCYCAVTQTYRHVTNSRAVTTVTSGTPPNDLQASVQKLISTTDEPDVLYKKIEVLAKGHDKSVLDSYEYFIALSAKELGLSLEVREPQRKIERFTLLKSIHIFKKHRVQYEMRTHYRNFKLTHLTGSTADVYLEYIQRNVPEGVALEITKTKLEKLPDHLKQPIWDTLDREEQKEPV
ncbi:28S ribosomal protein S10, mitochondrial isoform X2 [Hyla sarda]|uniref:28S ribosomal protein S10, mitochondrial isoform X2 n=1 Tax=Hyla sarda TaxID=327740 RepID=UPI0024C30D9D|nr:28S ribosomal protein S10, mitochondrial isoform X2 [Hyla sarda]